MFHTNTRYTLFAMQYVVVHCHIFIKLGLSPELGYLDNLFINQLFEYQILKNILYWWYKIQFMI